MVRSGVERSGRLSRRLILGGNQNCGDYFGLVADLRRDGADLVGAVDAVAIGLEQMIEADKIGGGRRRAHKAI